MNTTWLGRRWLPISATVLVVVALLIAYLLLRSPDTSGASPAATPAPSASATAGPPGSPAPSVPVRTTPVPPPTPGTVEQTVKPVKDGPTESVRLEQTADLDNEISIALVKVEPTAIKAVGPGDTSGPAIAVTVRIVNGSEQQVEIDNAVVTMSYGKKGTVGTPSPADPAEPFAGSVEAGDSAEGTYVFRVAEKTQDEVTVQVTYTAGAPVAKFDGAVK